MTIPWEAEHSGPPPGQSSWPLQSCEQHLAKVSSGHSLTLQLSRENLEPQWWPQLEPEPLVMPLGFGFSPRRDSLFQYTEHSHRCWAPPSCPVDTVRSINCLCAETGKWQSQEKEKPSTRGSNGRGCPVSLIGCSKEQMRDR